jgi:hypothetical protein
MRLSPLNELEPMRRRPSASAPDGRREPAVCDLRCGCGSLLARRVAEGVELKCRRCKRTVVLPLREG